MLHRYLGEVESSPRLHCVYGGWKCSAQKKSCCQDTCSFRMNRERVIESHFPMSSTHVSSGKHRSEYGEILLKDNQAMVGAEHGRNEQNDFKIDKWSLNFSRASRRVDVSATCSSSAPASSCSPPPQWISIKALSDKKRGTAEARYNAWSRLEKAGQFVAWLLQCFVTLARSFTSAEIWESRNSVVLVQVSDRRYPPLGLAFMFKKIKT